MKTKFTALALTLATIAAVVTPKTARANDAGAIIGGFIGGVLIANAINDHHHDTVVVRETDRCPPPDRCDDDRGYWRDVSVRVWVPGAWIVERDHWGRGCRRYVSGHYEFRNNRVWVSYDDRDNRRDYVRHHRRW